MKKIRSYLVGILVVFLFTGCSDMMNTPSGRVEEFMAKYQTMDSDVLEDLDKIVDKESDYDGDHKEEYKRLMQKQYQNLSYKIKDEKIDGNEAIVEVEIEVFDYASAKEDAEDYIDNHEEEFTNDEEESAKYKEDEYILKQLGTTTDKINYTITFYLTSDDEKWELQQLKDSDIEKIHGLYQS